MHHLMSKFYFFFLEKDPQTPLSGSPTPLICHQCQMNCYWLIKAGNSHQNAPFEVKKFFFCGGGPPDPPLQGSYPNTPRLVVARHLLPCLPILRFATRKSIFAIGISTLDILDLICIDHCMFILAWSCCQPSVSVMSLRRGVGWTWMLHPCMPCSCSKLNATLV